MFGYGEVKRGDHDLTRQHAGDPIGERIIVSGRVLDENGRPVPNTLVEIWQANSAGRYPHRVDQHDAPTDPNFTGCGRALTDKRGHYRFVTIRPGEYPWRNHYNAWRPAHIHFSLFGQAFVQRLVTQMYFPGDPLLAEDPMYNCVPDEQARQPADLRARLGNDDSRDCARLPLRHRAARARGNADGKQEEVIAMSLHATTSQTVGPYLHIGLTWLIIEKLAPAGVPGERVSIEGRVLDGDGKPVNDALVEIWQADSRGKYGGKRFRGFGRSATDSNGAFRFHTIKPGRVPGPGGKLQAPHIARQRLHARPAEAARLAHLLSGRAGEREGPGARAGAGGAARHAGREEARQGGRAGVERDPPGQGRDGVLRLLKRVIAGKPTDERLLVSEIFEGERTRSRTAGPRHAARAGARHSGLSRLRRAGGGRRALGHRGSGRRGARWAPTWCCSSATTTWAACPPAAW